MFDSKELLEIPPFSLKKDAKNKLQKEIFNSLTKHHYEKSLEYQYILSSLNYDSKNSYELEELPYIPIRLFKEYELLSCKKEDVIKTMTSSGTSGQQVSKIFLDKETSTNQVKVLSKILSEFMGSKRLPMLILDSKSVLKDRSLFSARGAGILGFSMFGKNHTYAFDDEMNINFEQIEEFLEKYKDEDILIFGFTFIVWDLFYKKLLELNKKLDLKRGILIHGGGWKKLIEQSVSDEIFKSSLKELCNLQKVYNYYGMVEQTGSIFMQCEKGHLHCSNYSDIIIRNSDFTIASKRQKGIIQVLSVLPQSYPGHSLLTEDEGELLGEDDCPCGRYGKYFKIHGRIKKAETRGCSDTFTK